VLIETIVSKYRKLGKNTVGQYAAFKYLTGGARMSNVIHLTDRVGSTKSNLKQMRASGNIPAVVYGEEIGSIQVTVNEKEINAAMKRNSRAILDAVLPSNKQHPVLIHEFQRDAISGKLLHIDFHQINMNESIETLVTIHFNGDPVGVKEGGILQAETHAVQVRCMPNKLPETIEVDIHELGIGDHILVSDLKVEDGIEILTEPSTMVVTILAIQKKDDTLDAPAAEEQADAEAEPVEK
jgi:large subunit ribosomal protein L25